MLRRSASKMEFDLIVCCAPEQSVRCFPLCRGSNLYGIAVCCFCDLFVFAVLEGNRYLGAYIHDASAVHSRTDSSAVIVDNAIILDGPCAYYLPIIFKQFLVGERYAIWQGQCRTIGDGQDSTGWDFRIAGQRRTAVYRTGGALKDHAFIETGFVFWSDGLKAAGRGFCKDSSIPVNRDFAVISTPRTDGHTVAHSGSVDNASTDFDDDIGPAAVADSRALLACGNDSAAADFDGAVAAGAAVASADGSAFFACSSDSTSADGDGAAASSTCTTIVGTSTDSRAV